MSQLPGAPGKASPLSFPAWGPAQDLGQQKTDVLDHAKTGVLDIRLQSTPQALTSCPPAAFNGVILHQGLWNGHQTLKLETPGRAAGRQTA